MHSDGIRETIPVMTNPETIERSFLVIRPSLRRCAAG